MITEYKSITHTATATISPTVSPTPSPTVSPTPTPSVSVVSSPNNGVVVGGVVGTHMKTVPVSSVSLSPHRIEAIAGGVVILLEAIAAGTVGYIKKRNSKKVDLKVNPNHVV